MRYAKTVAVIAGFGFITLALFVQGLLPALLPESRSETVSRAVRTRLTESNGSTTRLKIIPSWSN